MQGPNGMAPVQMNWAPPMGPDGTPASNAYSHSTSSKNLMAIPSSSNSMPMNSMPPNYQTSAASGRSKYDAQMQYMDPNQQLLQQQQQQQRMWAQQQMPQNMDPNMMVGGPRQMYQSGPQPMPGQPSKYRKL